MSIFAKQFGLESEGEPFIGENEAPVDAVIDTLEETSEIEEIESGEGGLEELEEGIETTADAAEQLEEVVEYLEKKQEEGGVTEGEAEAVEMATEAMLKPFMGYITVQIPSLESFSAEGGRARSTAIAIEGFKEQIEKMWKAVKDFVLGLVKKVTDWFQANLSAAGRMKKAAQAIAKKAEGISETSGSVELSAKLIRCLGSDGKSVSNNLKRDLTNVISAVSNNQALKELEGPSKTYTEALSKVDLSSVDKANASFAGTLEKVEVSDIFSKFGKKVEGDKRFEGDVYTTFAYQPFPVGGKSQFLSVATGNKSWYMKRVKLSMQATDAGVELKEAVVTALTKEQIKDATNAVVALADAIAKSNNDYKKSSDDVKKLLKEGDKLSSAIGKAPDDVQALESVKALKAILNGYATLGQVLATCQSQLVSEAKEIGYATLTYCSKSMKSGKK